MGGIGGVSGSGDGDGDRMKNSILERGAQGCVAICPPFMYSNTANCPMSYVAALHSVRN